MHPKWFALLEHMRTLGVYDQRFLTPRELSSQFFAGRTVLYPRVDRGKFAPGSIKGHVARRKTKHPAWQEISQMYVCENMRGNGVLRGMTFELIARTPPNIRLFGITSVRTVMNVFRECQMRAITKAVMPYVEEWGEQLGARDRLPESALSESIPAPQDGQRWLFVR